MKINIGLWKDKRAFTGLEAAIVLTAFVVVAAVFSYVVLGAGFFTSDTAKQTIHTGMDQATSSIELVGDVAAYGCNSTGGTTGTLDRIEYLVVTVALTAGQNPLDIGNGSDATIIAYTDENVYYNDLYNNSLYSDRGTGNNALANLSWTGDDDGDTLLEYGEKAKITVPIWGTGANASIIDLGASDRFTVEIKPAKGAVLVITRTIPAEIDVVTNLH
jgi:flagellin FlaB